MESLLLCTDLDRTLLPNGGAEESPEARERFARLAERPEIILVYVSGRHLASVEAAIQEYGVPRPDYAICDVGTSIHRQEVEDWRVLESWRTQLQRAWPEGRVSLIRDLLRDEPNLLLQEPERQSEFKLSYYLPGRENPREILEGVRRRLETQRLEAALIHSIDDSTGRGLLDLLPPGSGKRAAIEHLLQVRDLGEDSAFFAGDSGNDLEVLVSPIPAVLVANAAAGLREQVVEGARREGNASRLHLARGEFHGMNGNYAGGILEGLARFHPRTEAWWA